MRALLICLVACGGSTTQGGETTNTTTTGGNRLSEQSSGVRMHWDMDSEAELTGGGWHSWSSGTSTFENGILHTTSGGYEEWMQRDDRGPSAWFETVDNDVGFAIEARIRVLRADPECASVGMWIHDRTRFFRFYLRDGSVGIDKANRWHQVDTRQWHTYRIEGRHDWVRVLVDGDLAFEQRSERLGTAGGTMALNFGDLGGCSGSDVEWDWLGYDTGPRLNDVPCEICLPGESYRLAQLRVQLESQVDSSNTDDADPTCLALKALDHLARRVAPHLPGSDGYMHMPQAMRQAPEVRDAQSAGELARFIQRELERSPKPRAERVEPSRMPPPWVAHLSRIASMLEQGQSAPTWRDIATVTTMGLQMTGQAQQASVELMSELVRAARGPCR